MLTKMDLEDLVRERLSLPDNAVINCANFRICYDSEEIALTGTVQIDIPTSPDGENTQEEVRVRLTAPKSIFGVKKRGRNGKVIKVKPGFASESKAHAIPGVGGKITDAQVKGMKAVLHARKATGKLTDNQLAAMKALEGVRANKMTPEMRQQLKDIHDDSDPKKQS